MTIHSNRLIETIRMNGHMIGFAWEIKKYLTEYVDLKKLLITCMHYVQGTVVCMIIISFACDFAARQNSENGNELLHDFASAF